MVYIVRDLCNGKLVNCIDTKIHYASHRGNAIEFPTDSEADSYIKDNGLNWMNFGVERA